MVSGPESSGPTIAITRNPPPFVISTGGRVAVFVWGERAPLPLPSHPPKPSLLFSPSQTQPATISPSQAHKKRGGRGSNPPANKPTFFYQNLQNSTLPECQLQYRPDSSLHRQGSLQRNQFFRGVAQQIFDGGNGAGRLKHGIVKHVSVS